jgi:crossover junction endodeoxyribonuclease RuvC
MKIPPHLSHQPIPKTPPFSPLKTPASSSPPIVFGLDPGFDRLGWSVGQLTTTSACHLLAYGLITTTKTATIFERYHQLATELDALIAEFKPQEVALESLFFFKNQKTIITVAQARGVAINCFLRAHARCFEYSPPQIKLAVTGHGRADKKSIAKMVEAQFQLPPATKILDDTFDALAVLLTHAASRRLAV